MCRRWAIRVNRLVLNPWLWMLVLYMMIMCRRMICCNADAALSPQFTHWMCVKLQPVILRNAVELRCRHSWMCLNNLDIEYSFFGCFALKYCNKLGLNFAAEPRVLKWARKARSIMGMPIRIVRKMTIGEALLYSWLLIMQVCRLWIKTRQIYQLSHPESLLFLHCHIVCLGSSYPIEEIKRLWNCVLCAPVLPF